MNPSLLFQIIAVVSLLLIIVVIAVIVGFVGRKRGADGKKWRQRTGVSLVVILGVPILWVYFVNPLPSDEAMIKHFNAHRTEYEELAKGFIQAKKEGNESVKAWLASPRTLMLKKSIRAKDERNVGDEPAQWFSGVHANVFHDPDKGSIEFWIEDGFKYSWREMNSIWKTLIYFPTAPQIIDGKWDCPTSSGRKCLAPYNWELLLSLNGYPQFTTDRWPRCGIYVRKIDEHWFITYSAAC